MIDLETFYLNERTTIQCSAKDFSQITVLQLQTTGDVNKYTGCSKSTPRWQSADIIFYQSLISSTDCETAARSTPFIITLQPTITEQLRGASLYCYAYDAATSTEKQTTPVVVDTIRGERLDFYNIKC